DTQVVYAGTPRGIFKTKDGGENWSLIGYESFVLVDPQDNSHLYARDANVIRESTDQGISWKTVYSPQDGCPGNILSWAINPTDGKTLYVGGGDGCERGIYESRDNGHTWALIQKVENPPGYQIAPELDYLVIPMDWLLVRLQDGKAVVEYGPANETPASPGFVYSYCEPFLCKYPQGERGERESVRLGKPDIGTVTFIAPSPYDPNTIYVGGEGVAVTKDGGITWEQSNNGLGNTLLDLAAGLGDEGTLFLLPGECKGELGGGEGHIHDITQSLYHSTNGGSTWDFVTESGCYLIKDVDGATIYRLSTNYWWVGQALKGWLWRSQDGGRSWRRMLIPSDIETIVAHSSQAGHLFGFGKDPFYRTSVNPNFQEKYYYGSSDYGNTSKKQDPLSGTKLCYGSTLHFIDKYRPMTIDPNDGNHVFVIEDGKLLESHDSCDTTDIFATAPNTSMNSIAFDPNKSDVIYAGTDSGAYVSFDGGKTWNEINDGLLGATVVYSIVVDQEGNVYAATPYGIFKLESR
ncbi:MAG: hypothetical protein DYG86_18455, partial [Chloroflexi bacterium CFX2]|nr:hypothetical protein [Chloroflexi bacterium CFX2]